MALTELARYLPRVNSHNRFLRAGLRPFHRGDTQGEHSAGSPAAAPAAPGGLASD
jgi:putative (di)nucleoside polyphosphate hydrolase